jgi:transposase
MIKTIGIDLGKSVFHLIGMDDTGSVVLKKRFSRSQLVEFMANVAVCVVAMEGSVAPSSGL